MKILTQINSIDWVKLLKEAQEEQAEVGVQAVIRANPAGRKFYTIYGNTFPIKDKLKNLGFRYFKGTWGKPVDKIDDAIKNELSGLGIDISILSLDVAEEGQVQEVQGVQEVQEPQVELTPVEQELQRMKYGVEVEMKESDRSEKVRSLLGFVDRMIQRVAEMTDEAAQSEFVKNFLGFSAKFHNYSFRNQMLIWVQNPKASYIRGFKQWMEMGREVTNWDNGIAIVRPQVSKRYGPQEISSAPELERGSMEEARRMIFLPTTVFDIADTRPIPNYKEQTGKASFEPQTWRKDPNEAMEEVTALVNAVMEWARNEKIDVDFEEMAQDTGGFSAGGKIRVNNTFEGINLFSTMVHECAHEVLHWTKERKKGDVIPETRQEREIDAETTAYVVLQHYGFDTKDTPNYLALWKAKGEDIKQRRDSISKAVSTIVKGIDAKMKDMIIDDEVGSEKAESIIEDRTPEIVAKGNIRFKKIAAGKYKLNKKAWKEIGKKAGWMKKATFSTNHYMAPVPVTIYGANENEVLNAFTSNVYIEFEIEMEDRSWGIKSMEVHPQGTVSISIIVANIDPQNAESNEQTKEIVIDVSRLKQQRKKVGEACTIIGLALHLDANYQVDYDNSYLEVAK